MYSDPSSVFRQQSIIFSHLFDHNFVFFEVKRTSALEFIDRFTQRTNTTYMLLRDRNCLVRHQRPFWMLSWSLLSRKYLGITSTWHQSHVRFPWANLVSSLDKSRFPTKWYSGRKYKLRQFLFDLHRIVRQLKMNRLAILCRLENE